MHIKRIEILLAFLITMGMFFALYGFAALIAPPKGNAEPYDIYSDVICEVLDESTNTVGALKAINFMLTTDMPAKRYPTLSPKDAADSTLWAIQNKCPSHYSEVMNVIQKQSLVTSLEPTPPCGYYSNLPWSPCAEQSPFVTYPGLYDPTGKTPGMMGPWGYVPK